MNRFGKKPPVYQRIFIVIQMQGQLPVEMLHYDLIFFTDEIHPVIKTICNKHFQSSQTMKTSPCTAKVIVVQDGKKPSLRTGGPGSVFVPYHLSHLGIGLCMPWLLVNHRTSKPTKQKNYKPFYFHSQILKNLNLALLQFQLK